MKLLIFHEAPDAERRAKAHLCTDALMPLLEADLRKRGLWPDGRVGYLPLGATTMQVMRPAEDVRVTVTDYRCAFIDFGGMIGQGTPTCHFQLSDGECVETFAHMVDELIIEIDRALRENRHFADSTPYAKLHGRLHATVITQDQARDLRRQAVDARDGAEARMREYDARNPDGAALVAALRNGGAMDEHGNIVQVRPPAERA